MLHPRTPPNPRNSNSSVQIQIQPNSQFEFVPRDTKKSEFLDLVDFGGVTTSEKPVVRVLQCTLQCVLWVTENPVVRVLQCTLQCVLWVTEKPVVRVRQVSLKFL